MTVFSTMVSHKRKKCSTYSIDCIIACWVLELQTGEVWPFLVENVLGDKIPNPNFLFHVIHSYFGFPVSVDMCTCTSW